MVVGTGATASEGVRPITPKSQKLERVTAQEQELKQVLARDAALVQASVYTHLCESWCIRALGINRS